MAKPATKKYHVHGHTTFCTVLEIEAENDEDAIFEANRQLRITDDWYESSEFKPFINFIHENCPDGKERDLEIPKDDDSD